MAIARTLLSDPDYLLMDEAGASLDHKSDMTISAEPPAQLGQLHLVHGGLPQPYPSAVRWVNPLKQLEEIEEGLRAIDERYKADIYYAFMEVLQVFSNTLYTSIGKVAIAPLTTPEIRDEGWRRSTSRMGRWRILSHSSFLARSVTFADMKQNGRDRTQQKEKFSFRSYITFYTRFPIHRWRPQWRRSCR